MRMAKEKMFWFWFLKNWLEVVITITTNNPVLPSKSIIHINPNNKVNLEFKTTKNNLSREFQTILENNYCMKTKNCRVKLKFKMKYSE